MFEKFLNNMSRKDKLKFSAFIFTMVALVIGMMIILFTGSDSQLKSPFYDEEEHLYDNIGD